MGNPEHAGQRSDRAAAVRGSFITWYGLKQAFANDG
jgi:hypothetical protein